MVRRSIARVSKIPALGPGFAGEHHQAALVIEPGDLPATDPFFLMADDNITEAGRLGDAHPHAGLETVTFMLRGTLEDINDRLEEGDVEWMTAGSGIVHGQDTRASTGMRLFQLWLILPEAQRNMTPRVQILRRPQMPVHTEPGAVARVYSGRLGSAVGPTLNAVPILLADIELTPGASFAPQLAASDNAFIVVIDGDIEAGTSNERLEANMVGWTDPSDGGESSLALRAGDRGARLLLYAGQQQNITVAARGPFIAGSPEELAGYYAAYRRGNFPDAGSLRPPGRG